ncbi:MAG: c-type cytochrome [Candidatus Eisenbacteria bacterium]|nr:c-type cytochrome [Candidatus Eisenbacteria bacterium]
MRLRRISRRSGISRTIGAIGLTLLIGSVAGCGEDSTTNPGPEVDPLALSGGSTTVFSETSLAYTLPAANLDAQQLARHLTGDVAFEAVYVTAPAAVNSGLGPAYNEPSCESCHARNGRARNSRLVRISVPGRDARTGAPLPAPGFGGQLQEQAIVGMRPEVVLQVSYEERPGHLPDGEAYSLRNPVYEIETTGRALPTSFMISPRVAPPVFGLGLLEAISDQTLLEFAGRPEVDGISGRVNWVWSRDRGGTAIGRFGWKANEPTLRQQTAHAFQEDMGVTSPIFPEEATAGQQEYADSLSDDPEIEAQTVDEATFYVQSLGVPARRGLNDPMVQRGSTLFDQVGCAHCHVRELQTAEHPEIPGLSGQTIRPYTDLLLHDMGSDLADNRPDFEADGREWRTPPLWGIGLLETVNGHLELLHDGRARGHMEAILWHGGEADSSAQRVKRLPKADRDALVRFLRSL